MARTAREKVERELFDLLSEYGYVSYEARDKLMEAVDITFDDPRNGDAADDNPDLIAPDRRPTLGFFLSPEHGLILAPESDNSASIRHTIDTTDNPEFAAAVDGMCSVLLALYVEGLLVDSEALHAAVQTAMDAIIENHGDL